MEDQQWESKDTSVVSINNEGKLKANTPEKTQIELVSTDLTFTWDITVIEPLFERKESEGFIDQEEIVNDSVTVNHFYTFKFTGRKIGVFGSLQSGLGIYGVYMGEIDVYGAPTQTQVEEFVTFTPKVYFQ